MQSLWQSLVRGLSTGSRRLPRRVVYTCMFGYSERFNDFAYERSNDIDFICFTDDPELRSSFWTMRLVAPDMLDPPRLAKKVKALPHVFLPEYDWSLYIDNTVQLKVAPGILFARYLANAQSPFVCFRHSERTCVYDEAAAVVGMSLDNADRVHTQMRSYKALGYPGQNGLTASSFILRRHLDPSLTPVMDRWHQQVLLHSFRDQLSLDPVMWFAQFEPEYVPLDFGQFELFDWPVPKNGQRLPRDFDDGRYFELHPEVRESKMSPRQHYLLHGMGEGRPYK
jgi:hypothetical protein